MRRAAVLAVLGLVLAPVAAHAGSAPPGATAQCRDGTYSYSQHHSGTCSHHGGVAVWLDGSSPDSSPPATTTTPAPVTTPAPATTPMPTGMKLGRAVLLGKRSRTRGCKLGAKPDRSCSPGAYYSGLTKAVLCSSSFHTSTVRDVPQSEKSAVEREYGMATRLYGRTLEIDHIVSLELGGSNSIANLYPEKANAHSGYHVKDKLENKLHALVCSGVMTLRAAQVGIAWNWQALYKKVYGVSAL